MKKKNMSLRAIIVCIVFSLCSITAMQIDQEVSIFKKYVSIKSGFQGYWVCSAALNPTNFYATFYYENQYVTFPIFESNKPQQAFEFKDLPSIQTNFIPWNCFSPQQEFFAYIQNCDGINQTNIVIVNTKTGKVEKTINNIFLDQNVAATISYSCDGRYLVVTPGKNQPIKIFDGATAQEFRSFSPGDHNSYPNSVATSSFTTDFTLLAVGCTNHTILMWDIASQNKFILEGHTDEVFCVRFSPNNKYFASASGDKTIRIWDVEKKECIKILKNASRYKVSSVAWHPDNKHIAAEAGDGAIKIWNVQTGEMIQELTELKGSGPSLFIQFSSNNQLMVQYAWWGIGLWQQE